jgi:hypothetical protein
VTDIGVFSAIHLLLQRFLVTLRTLLLGGGGLLLLFGSAAFGLAGAGPLGCVIAAFVANRGWRAQGWTGETVSLDEKLQDNKLKNCCIRLVIYLNCTMMHGLTNFKFYIQILAHPVCKM